MSAENIIEKIKRQSLERVNAVAEEAKLQAAKKRGETLAQAEADASEIITRAKADAADEIEHSRLQAELEARKNTLAKKRALLDRAFDMALGEMLAMSEQKWSEYMTRTVLESGLDGDIAVTVRKEDRARAAALLKKWSDELTLKTKKPCSFALTEDNAVFAGGAYFSGERFDVDASFERILREQRGGMESELGRMLFGAGE